MYGRFSDVFSAVEKAIHQHQQQPGPDTPDTERGKRRAPRGEGDDDSRQGSISRIAYLPDDAALAIRSDTATLGAEPRSS